MKVPLEISFRNISKNVAIESLIRKKVDKLERIHDNIISCHAVVERIHKDAKGVSPYRVRVSVHIPHSHEIVATSEPGKTGDKYNLDSVIRDSFENLTRRLKSVVEFQRREVKRHSLKKPAE